MARRRKKRKWFIKPLLPRFPRLESSNGKLKYFEGILRGTYNRLMKDRGFSHTWDHYDIYRTKRGDEAQRCFIVLADTLLKEHIDPSLYLKILSKYGWRGRKGFMPYPRWLMTKKALDIFKWLVQSERKKFIIKSDFRSHIEEPEDESVKHIVHDIRESRERVQETMESFNLKIGEAALFHGGTLSPWFLAICVSFLRLDGMDYLNGSEAAMVRKCQRHLMANKEHFRKALREYSKLQ